MENDSESRTILTQEELQKYKNQIENAENIVALYAILLARDSGMNFADVVNELFGDESDETEFIDFVNEMLNGYDIRTITESQFLEYIPSEYRNVMNQFKGIYNTGITNNLKFREILALNQIEDLYQDFMKIRDMQIQNIVKTISSSNLRQIPPEMYNDITWIDRIDFQNTGANIDMNQWTTNHRYKGSFKGCNLISFNPKYYAKKYPTKDDLDEEQYLVVLNGYRIQNYLPRGLCYLLEGEYVKENGEWFFDKLLQDEKVSIDYLVDIWRVMDYEQQNKYSLIFDKIIEKSKFEKGLHYWNLKHAVGKTDFKILESYHKKLIELCTIDKSFHLQEYLLGIWEESPIEYKRAHFEEVIEQAFKEPNQLIVFRLQKIYEACNTKLQEEKFSYTIDKFIDKEHNTIKYQYFLGFFDALNSDFEMPKESLKQFFELYTNENNSILRDNFEEIWKHIGANNQAKYLESLITLQKQLGISEDEMYKIWNSTDVKVRLEKFDSFTEVIKSYELLNLEHQVKGEGYIQLIRDLGDEGQKVIDGNLQQFLYSLREKYDGNTEEVEKYETYDTKFIQQLLDMDSKGNLDKDNINIIIDNLPKLGIDIFNRIKLSNSDMLSQYSKQLIKIIVTLPKSEAIKTVEEFENIFAQNRLPQFMKLYKYFELVADKELSEGNIMEGAISRKTGEMSPVLENSPSEKMGKRIVFSDLMKIAMDSNNRSMKNFINVLETGNQAYAKFIKAGGKIAVLNDGERAQLDEFVKTVYCLYENSAVARIDKTANKKIYLTGDIEQDALKIGKRYSKDGRVDNLPDLVLKTYIGPYQELFGGIVTVKQIREYMENKLAESNEYHRQLARKPIELSVGDMVKGIEGYEKILQDLFQDGIRAGEFLGVASHSDATPLDTDFGIILPSNDGKTLSEKIQNTPAGTYGSFYVVVKHNLEKNEYTRLTDSIEEEDKLDKSSDRMAKLKEKDEIKRRVEVRSNRYI